MLISCSHILFLWVMWWIVLERWLMFCHNKMNGLVHNWSWGDGEGDQLAAINGPAPPMVIPQISCGCHNWSPTAKSGSLTKETRVMDWSGTSYGSLPLLRIFGLGPNYVPTAQMLITCGFSTPTNLTVVRALTRTKLKGVGGPPTIGHIETAENVDTCVVIIASYILYMQACVRTHNRLPPWCLARLGLASLLIARPLQ